MKRRLWTLAPWFIIFSVVMFAMATFTFQYSRALCYIESGIATAAAVLVAAFSFWFRGYIRNMVKNTANHISGFDADYLDRYKYPVVAVGEKGLRKKFNRTYFAEGGLAFEFLRKKTSETSNGMSVVIVPIIKPLQVILDEIGAKPAKDAYVFPQIFRGIEDETIRRKLTVQENSNIKDRVIRICKEVLGWEKKPSGTWARHSFATNLKHLGVEELYISESMGHSLGNNITAGYQDMYPLETRFEYNSKLLNLEEEKPDIDVDSMTPEQMKEMLKKVLGQK